MHLPPAKPEVEAKILRVEILFSASFSTWLVPPTYCTSCLDAVFRKSFGGIFFIPTTLALVTSFLILFYISSTSHLYTRPLRQDFICTELAVGNSSQLSPPISGQKQKISLNLFKFGSSRTSKRSKGKFRLGSKGKYMYKEVFHDRDIFMEDYLEMNKSFKIYVYPHRRNDPFANALLPVDFEPGGNYASESFFKKNLLNSHFITSNPAKADLFFLPFSIARLRHDSRVGVGGLQDFVRDYIHNISHNYPFWNRTGGADHFYAACHSVGKSAMEKADAADSMQSRLFALQAIFLSGYVAHKDACLPQIWPRKGDPPNLTSTRRKKLAFFAGSINSPVREKLIQEWANDTEISVHFGRLSTPCADQLLGSKFCLHVKGFEVNTARIADSLYHGCVPVIIANHYDLPFADILNWKSFAVVVATLDIPLLKRILKAIRCNEYLTLQKNVLEVRRHFMWHSFPDRYDAFYMDDTEISVHFGRLSTPCADQLLGSKFCLHVKGFEVNTARIADSLYHSCVPVIIANHYDLPFADILNWKSFAVVVATLDIPLLKRILKAIRCNEYLTLQKNVLEVRRHFMWHSFPDRYDAFYMVMYELWLQRSSLRILIVFR